MKSMKMIKPRSSQGGVVLLETLIAILIFTFGILGLVGLQGAMLKGTTNANYRVEASMIAQQVLGRMWADPCNLATFPAVQIVPTLPNGQVTVVHDFSGVTPTDTCGGQNIDQTTVTVTWMLPGAGDPTLDRDDPSWSRVRQSASITGG